MKYAIKEFVGEIGTLQDKSQEVTSNITEECKMLFVEHPLVDTPEGILVGNTCTGIKVPMIDKKMKDMLYQKLGFSKEKMVNVIYGFFNGNEFSDLLELSISNKMFNHEVGSPTIFNITGGAHRIACDVSMALPQWSELKKFLMQIHYRGEVSVGISNTSMITDFYCGHNSAAFACYVEIHKTNTDKGSPVITNILDFVAGEKPMCKVFSSFVLFNRVSTSPFPFGAGRTIKIPDSAERHVWKVRYLQQESALVLAHADAVKVAQSRIRNSINNMLSYDKELQYRTDFGVSLDFILCSDAHKIALEKSKFPRKGEQSGLRNQAEQECKLDGAELQDSMSSQK